MWLDGNGEGSQNWNAVGAYTGWSQLAIPGYNGHQVTGQALYILATRSSIVASTSEPNTQCDALNISVFNAVFDISDAFDGLYTLNTNNEAFGRPWWDGPHDQNMFFSGSSWLISGEGDNLLSCASDAYDPTEIGADALWTHSSASGTTFTVSIRCINSQTDAINPGSHESVIVIAVVAVCVTVSCLVTAVCVYYFRSRKSRALEKQHAANAATELAAEVAKAKQPEPGAGAAAAPDEEQEHKTSGGGVIAVARVLHPMEVAGYMQDEAVSKIYGADTRTRRHPAAESDAKQPDIDADADGDAQDESGEVGPTNVDIMYRDEVRVYILLFSKPYYFF